MKSFKKKLISITKHFFVFAIITAWIFSPWANLSFRIADREISLGLKTDEARAAISITRVQSANNTTGGDPASATFSATPIEGNLLVAIASERSGTTEANHTINGTGWEKRIGRDSEIANSTNRRTLSVWTKVAGADEATNIQVDDGTNKAKYLLIQEFSAGEAGATWTFEQKADNDSGTTDVAELSTGTTASVSGSDLFVLATMIWRNGPGTSPSWTNNLGGSVFVDGGTNGIDRASAFYHDTVSGTKESTASWTGNYDTTGGIMVFSVASAAPEPISISGTLYSDEGKTAVTSGKTISMYMATSSNSVATSTTSDGSGNFSFAGLDEPPTAGAPFTAWVDADISFRASMVDVASTTSNNITGLDLYQNRVIVKHESEVATSTTLAKLNIFDGDNDSDIQFFVNDSNNGLEVKAGSMLYIWPGTHFDTSIEADAGDAILVHGGVSNDTDGILKFGHGEHPASPGVSTSSIITLGGNVVIAGSWLASSTGSILNHNSKLVTFAATSTGKSLYASSTPFYNLTFDGFNGGFGAGGGGWTFREMASTTNDFTITTGTVIAPSLLSVTGDFTNNGTFTAGTGTTTFDGAVAQTLSGTMTGSSALANVEFNNSLTGASADWYHEDWLYRKKITLEQASTTLTAFPALVSLSDTDLSARAQADGDDILFTSSDGTTRLSHEIENYASGGLNAWVKIPTLSSSAANDIYMYYGNAATSSEQTPTTVWDGSYEAVWHMSEDPTGGAPQILDSTANNNDGTIVGTWIAGDQTLGSTGSTTSSGAAIAAKIGGSLYFTGLLTRDYIAAGAGSSVDLNDKLTASIWVKGGDQSQDTFAQMFGKVLADNVGWGIDTATAGPGTRVRVDTSGGIAQTKNFGNALDNTWRRLTVILDSGNIDLFLNENQTIDSTYTHGTGLSTTEQVNIGRRSNNSNYYEGFLDEARIASTTLSADWLAIEYDNISATTTFYTSIGSEETDLGGGSGGITFSNNASTTNILIMQGGIIAPSLLSVSGHFDNSGIFDANSGTTTFNGTSQQYISGFATGTNAFAGLEFTNITASTTFLTAASSTATLSAIAGARIEFASTEQIAQDTGWVPAGTGANDASVGTTVWTSPENITADNDTRASVSLGAESSQYLYASNFNFSSVPDSAIIVGIETRRQAHQTSFAACQDSVLRLFNAAGTPAGNDKSAGSSWTTTVDTEVTYGGPSDTWGLSPDVSDIKDTDWGWGISATNPGSTGDCAVDFMEMKVHYTTSNTATTTAQNISFAGESGNEIYLHSSTPATAWNFEVPSGRSVSYVNVKDSNACYTSGNNISASNSTDGGGNTCWDITAPSSDPGTLTIANHTAGQESDTFNTGSLTDTEFFAFKMTPTNENITTTLVFNIDSFGIGQSDITNAQIFEDSNSDGNITGAEGDTPLGDSGTVSITGNKGTITFSGFSISSAADYILQADISGIGTGDELTIGLIASKITAVGDTTSSSITPTGTVTSVSHSRDGAGVVGGGGKSGDSVTADDAQTGGGGGGGEQTGESSSTITELIFSDTFTGSNGTDLVSHTPDTGTSWQEVIDSAGTLTLQVQSNQGRASADSASNRVVYVANPASTHADMSVQFKLNAFDPDDKPMALVLRYQDANNMYLLLIENEGGGSELALTFVKAVSSTWSDIDTADVVAASLGDTISFSVEGNTLTAKVNDTVVKQKTDTSITSAGKAGVYFGVLPQLWTNAAVSIDWLFDDFKVYQAPVQEGGGGGGGGRSEAPRGFMNFASVITAFGNILLSIWNGITSFFFNIL
ncbi:MAG: DUF2341 domain-containing protein [bacterium]|nr:DUF2341 domain-containing protein [bacterium]